MIAHAKGFWNSKSQKLIMIFWLPSMNISGIRLTNLLFTPLLKKKRRNRSRDQDQDRKRNQGNLKSKILYDLFKILNLF